MTSQILADYYVHSIDPFLIQFSEKWGIRWYGLAYVLGFFCAIVLLRWFARKDYTELKERKVADFILYGAILGVMLGGRLGFLLFYNRAEFFSNPMVFFDFLGGGMASHGGIIGLIIFTWFYARKTKLSWAGLGDNLVVVAPLGLMFGRLANFVNGELYGRITDVKWAMKFPSELGHVFQNRVAMFPNDKLTEISKKVNEVDAEAGMKALGALTNNPQPGFARRIAIDTLVRASEKSAEVRAVLGEFLNPRHPSQLYQAFGEGLLLFAILFLVRIRFKNLYHGILTGLFFIIYAINRIVAENFREPDSNYIGALTKGQFYSTFMIVIGIAFIVWAMKTKRTNRI